MFDKFKEEAQRQAKILLGEDPQGAANQIANNVVGAAKEMLTEGKRLGDQYRPVAGEDFKETIEAFNARLTKIESRLNLLEASLEDK